MARHRIVITLLVITASCPAYAQNIVPLKDLEPFPLPAIAFKDEAGVAHAFTAVDNTLTILHLWATWCVPCVAELPEVDKTQKTYEERGVRIIAISLDTDMGKVKKFFSEHKIVQLKPYLDNKNATFKAIEARGLPTTLIINPQGEIIARADGPLDWKARETLGFIENQLQ